jgi:hypothetical protein
MNCITNYLDPSIDIEFQGQLHWNLHLTNHKSWNSYHS